MSFDPAAAITGDAKAGLKSVEAPESKLVKPEDDPQFAAFQKIYDDNGGDLAAISAAMGGVAFKDGAAVTDSTDFAKKLLSGELLAD